MKNTDMLEWMNGLDAKYLTEAARPVIRQKKRRIVSALIAAAAAAACMTAGAFAYGMYHKESVQQYLGTAGEELFSEYAVKGTNTFSNDKASVTVDALLYDGYSAYAVMTIEAFDPSVIVGWDWSPLPERICDADGNAVERDENRRYEGKFIGSITAGGYWDGEALPSNQGKFWVNFGDMRDWNGETLHMKYEDQAWQRQVDQETLDGIKNNERNKAYYELLRGLQVDFTFEKNCECYTLTAVDGRTVLLSDFEAILPCDATGDDGYHSQDFFEKMHHAPVRLIYQDGTEQEVVSRNYNFIAEDYFSMEIATSYFLEEEGFTRVFPASEIAAIEIDGVRYEK